MKLLIIDHERNLVEMLSGWLKTLGYEIRRAYTGAQARQEWEQQQPDLVIVESALEGVDALKLCRDMRDMHDALILVLTACTDVQNEVHCLEAGADDYLRKPFFPEQLLARIHALSRRGRSSLALRPSSIVKVGSLRVDSLHNEVSVRGKIVRLTPTETKILYLLSLNVNSVCTASQIVSYVWGFGNDGDVSLIKAHIRHLRQKIEASPSNPTYIQTVPGVGYTFVYRPAEEGYASDALSPLKVVSF
jgi:DNA-binding response OmpR family regulator